MAEWEAGGVNKKQVILKSAGFELDSVGTNRGSRFMGTGCLDENTGSLNTGFQRSENFCRIYGHQQQER